MEPLDHVTTAPTSAPVIGRLKDLALVSRALALRARYKRFEPAGFFFGGVLWDAATLRRIDALIDNVLLSAYLVSLGVLVVGAILVHDGRSRQRFLLEHKEALPAAIQFLMGALFSAYVVFYFQSASWTPTSTFLIILIVLLVANEFVHRRLFNIYLLFALYYLAAFSFFVFFIPVITKTMNYGSFVLAGSLSLALVAGLLFFLHGRNVFERPRHLLIALGIPISLFALLNLFYLENWIPPVPLALRHAGVYHEVSRQGDIFELRHQRVPWYQFWIDDDRRFRYVEGDAVHCFAAIFAPTHLRKTVYHEWHYYEEDLGMWMTTDTMRYEIEGRRDQGYRWFSRKRNVKPGKWRVDIRTNEGRTLGRVRFVVEAAPEGPREFRTILYE